MSVFLSAPEKPGMYRIPRAAYAAHPERFVRREPTPQALPTETWINPPTREAAALAAAH